MSYPVKKKQKLQHTEVFVVRLLALPDELLQQLASWSPPSVAVLSTACRGLRQLLPWAAEAQEANFATIRQAVAEEIEAVVLRGGFVKFGLSDVAPHQKYEGGYTFDLRGCLNLNAGPRFHLAERIATVLYFYCRHSVATGQTRLQLSLHSDDVHEICEQCGRHDITRCLHLAGDELRVRGRAEIEGLLKQLVSVPMLNLLGDAYMLNDNFDLSWMELLRNGVTGTARAHWVHQGGKRFCTGCEKLNLATD